MKLIDIPLFVVTLSGTSRVSFRPVVGAHSWEGIHPSPAERFASDRVFNDTSTMQELRGFKTITGAEVTP